MVEESVPAASPAPAVVAAEPSSADVPVSPGVPVSAPPSSAVPSDSPSAALSASPSAEAEGDLDLLGSDGDAGGFTVRLENFTGPFDLLLQLIGKHKLDVTEVALHQVTDDFIAYIRAMGDEWDLDEVSEFLVVAATLLDLKAARLLPTAEVEDEEDLALLEARDLLFARLLQYKAYKEAAAFIADLEGTGAKRWPRAVTMEPRYAEALPDLVLGIGAERLFKLALKQFTPKPGPPEVSIAHIHQVRVSVREHATLLRERLRRAGSATFSLLIADCDNTLEVVARFLALLELYREGLIDFEQPVSLDELTVRWIGGDTAVGDLDIDDYEGSPPEPEAPPAESVTEADLTAAALSNRPAAPDLDPDPDPDDLDALLSETNGDAGESDTLLGETNADVGESDALLGETNADVGESDALLGEMDADVGESDALLGGADADVGESDALLGGADADVGESGPLLDGADADPEVGDGVRGETDVVAGELDDTSDDVRDIVPGEPLGEADDADDDQNDAGSAGTAALEEQP